MKKAFKSIIIASLSLIPIHAFADDGQAQIANEKAEKILQRLGPISNGRVDVITQDKETDLRMRAMKEVANTIGAQEGYSYYINRFISTIETNDQYMRHFDFSALMTAAGKDSKEMYVLPPVIEQVKNAEAVNDKGTQIKLSGDVYRILTNVRLVTAPPTWRDYLVPPVISDTNKAPNDLLPKNNKEKEKWYGWVREGFISGMEQGDREMKNRVSQLRTDYVGMIKYMELVEKGMVQQPVVAMQHINVEGDESEMKVRSSIYEITQGANLVPNLNVWKSNQHDDNRSSLR